MRFREVFTLVAVLFFAGCKDKPYLNGLSGGTMTAEIDGSHFEADGVIATRTAGSMGVGEGFVVEGTGDSGFPSIKLNLFSKNIGSYNLGVSGMGNTTATFTANAGDLQTSSSGSITIERVDYSEGGVVKGTFTFVTPDNDISNGTFEIRFSN